VGHVEPDRAPPALADPEASTSLATYSALRSLLLRARRFVVDPVRVWRAGRPSVFARRRVPLHDPDFPLVLLFSPKCGCTSLVKWFLFQTGGLENAEDHAIWIHQFRTRVLNERPGYREEAVRLMVSCERPIIKLVRHPCDRAVSSYLHTLRGANSRRENDWARKLIASARGYHGLNPTPADALSFRCFLAYLAFRRCDFPLVNTHVAHQFLRAEAGKVTRLLKLENFLEDIRLLEADYGLPQAPVSLFESAHHRRRTVDARHGRAQVPDIEFTHDDARKNRIPPYGLFLDAEMRALIRKCYAPDFEQYRYA